MAGNDAEREERLVACLNILRRTPIKDAEEVRYRWTAGRMKDTTVWLSVWGRVFVAAIDHPLRAFTDELLLFF